MRKVTLVIMAAGLGNRYGEGIKQLAEVGPNGEIIMDYSIYDALKAGFNKVVFVIRKDLEKAFKEAIGNRMEKIVEVSYVYQELSDIPEQFKEKLNKRIKPWGTGQAVLCCRNVVNEPFLVINADDYYGREAYNAAYDYLMEGPAASERESIGMVGFILENTLSENGAVTRGICKVNDNGNLMDIEETYEIEKSDGCIIAMREGEKIVLHENSPVSMNMWALHPAFFAALEKGFIEFLENLQPEDIKSEYLMPKIIGEMLRKKQIRVDVLESRDKWFGVTYKEDRSEVVECIQKLIAQGVYPQHLF